MFIRILVQICTKLRSNYPHNDPFEGKTYAKINYKKFFFCQK